MRDKALSFIEKLKKIEVIYAILALTFGLIFIFTIPPGWNPDERQHYWRSQSLSHGNAFPDIYKAPGFTHAGGPLTEHSRDFIDSYGGTANPSWPNFTLNFPMTNNDGAFERQTDEGATVPVIFSATSKNTPFVYTPYVIAMWTGNTIGLPLLVSFIFAKILGLITLVAAFFFAIRIIPKGKWLVATVGLLPSTITQSSAITADVMTLAVSVLFIALVIREAFSKKPISKLTFAAIFGLIAGIGLVKASYLPIAALLLIIPLMRKEYRGVKTILWVGGLSLLSALPGVLWVLSVLSIPDYYTGNVIPSEQSHLLSGAPLNFIGIILSTYLSDAQQIIHRGFFGSFIWDTVALPLVFSYLGVAALTLSLLVRSKRELVRSKLPLSAKVTMWLTFSLIGALITYALYIYYTPVGASSTLGLQGRYFLPFVLLPLLTLHYPVIRSPKDIKIKIAIIIMLASMLIAATSVIWWRIYG